jgi:hypothetical protein
MGVGDLAPRTLDRAAYGALVALSLLTPLIAVLALGSPRDVAIFCYGLMLVGFLTQKALNVPDLRPHEWGNPVFVCRHVIRARHDDFSRGMWDDFERDEFGHLDPGRVRPALTLERRLLRPRRSSSRRPVRSTSRRVVRLSAHGPPDRPRPSDDDAPDDLALTGQVAA